MNKQRRAAINKIVVQMNDLLSEVEAIRDEEQEAFDAMPEGIQESERGQASDAARDALENAILLIEEATENLEEAAGE